MKTLFKFFTIAIFLLLFSACSETETSISVVENYAVNSERSEIKTALFSAIEHSMNNRQGLPKMDDCEEPDFGNCFELDSLFLTDWMDISHCSEGLSDSCRLIGYMLINVCWDANSQTMLIDFDEEYAGHFIDYGTCVIDDIHFDVQHSTDYICELDVFYEYYIDEMMEIVVDFFADENMSCGSPITKVRSRYQKDLCVAVCKSTSDKIDYRTSRCGDSFACCVLNEEWCVEEDGSIRSTVISYEKIGDGCDQGDWPCNEGLGTICYTRDCPLF